MFIAVRTARPLLPYRAFLHALPRLQDVHGTLRGPPLKVPRIVLYRIMRFGHHQHPVLPLRVVFPHPGEPDQSLDPRKGRIELLVAACQGIFLVFHISSFKRFVRERTAWAEPLPRLRPHRVSSISWQEILFPS